MVRSSFRQNSQSTKLTYKDNEYTAIPFYTPQAMININAFIALIYSHHILPTSPTDAIWAMFLAFEQRPVLSEASHRLRQDDENEKVGCVGDDRKIDFETQREIDVLAAAQWILFYGQELFTQILWHPEEGTEAWEEWDLEFCFMKRCWA